MERCRIGRPFGVSGDAYVAKGCWAKTGVRNNGNDPTTLPQWSLLLLYSQTLFYIFWLIFPGAKWPPFRRRCFRMLFHELKVFYLIDISLKFVPKGPIGNNPVVQIMAWCRIGDKSLSELNLSRFAEACGTKWRWIKTFLRQMSHHGVSTRRSFSKYMQICHYNEITWALRRLESPAVQLLFNPIFRLTTRVRSFVRRIRR